MAPLLAVLLSGVAAGHDTAWLTDCAAPIPKHLMKERPRPAAPQGKWVLELARRGDKPFPFRAGSMTIEFGDGVLTTVTGVGGEKEQTTLGILKLEVAKKVITTVQHRNSKTRQIVNPDAAYGYAIVRDKLILATRQGPNLAFSAIDPGTAGKSDVVMVFKRLEP